MIPEEIYVENFCENFLFGFPEMVPGEIQKEFLLKFLI